MCMICDLVSGKGNFPLPIVYEGKHWIINQAYPSKIKGWLALSIKKHKTAFHELTKEELKEMTHLLYVSAKILRKITKCEKEYVLSSNEGVAHFHFHVVPRLNDHPEEWIGGKVYSAIRIKKEESIPVKELVEFSELLKENFRKVTKA